MQSCCGDKAGELRLLRARQASVLKWVLLINSVMFFVEASAGVLGRSTALLADSLDMFGDASVYALTLYVISKSSKVRARAALVKGAAMGIFGVAVLSEAVVKLVAGRTPEAAMMSGFGLLALVANVVCLMLLFRHRTDDLNMRSSWLCSRNDIIANAGVIVAGGAVALSGANWPDVAVGAIIAGLFLKGAFAVVRDSLVELRGGGTNTESRRLPLANGPPAP